MHDYQGLFTALRAIYGPHSNAVAQVKSTDGSVLLTDLKDITGHWKEYFSNLLNQQGTADERVTSQLCVHTPKDDLCTLVMMKELEKALQETRRGKAPGLDGILPEILKLGGPKLKAHLLSLYNTCWQGQTLLQDFKDALIVMIYKRKGDRRDCNNHCGISLFSIAGMVLAKIILNRLRTISEQLLPESQCGFHAGRSTADMIFTLRQLQEKAMEQQRSLNMVFVDFSKTFNTANRWTLWKVLKAYGCPESFINMIRQFHDGMRGRMSHGGDISDAFTINHGVKQGCVLAPTPFTLYLGAVLEAMSANLANGVYIQTHSDGKLFNLACLKAEIITNTLCVRELLYADDMPLVATDYNDIQEIVNQFHSAATMFGLKINTKNTELMY